MSVEPRILRWHRRRHPLLRTAHPLTRRSIYILPTRTGLVFAAVLLAMLGWSINYNASLGFALVFLLGTIAIEAMRRTHDNLLGLTVHPPLAEPVFAGDTAFIRLRLEAPAGEIRYGVVVRTAAGVETGGDLDGPLAALDLPVPAQRRGRLASGALRVSTCFPLGLFTAWTWVEFQPSGLVWPQPAGVAQLPAGTHGKPQQQPARTESAGDEDFAGLRPWRRGDPATHVAWKPSARSGQLQVKQFSAPPGGDELMLDLASAPGDGIEARLSQLTLWTIEADRADVRFGLRLGATELAPARGSAHRFAVLERLALYGEGADAA
ncbi:MAG TPA: DUF58 domain-containing protein [Plasticicumulans sp.]|nr:DUF58 domain-containing protein [Plasticicumulans sp.]